MQLPKYALATVLLIFISVITYAQHVGIGVTTPLEVLQVDSTIKIGKNLPITSGTPGRKNLLKFGDEGYVTIGEEETDDKLFIRFGDLVFLKNPSAVGNGYIGIGTAQPTAALDVTGGVRLRTNAAAGNVLTSDAAGNATWQAPASSSNTAFSAYLTNNINLTSGAYADVAGFTEDFDDGNVFNPATGVFTVPATGLYVIETNMSVTETGTDTKYLNTSIRRDGGTLKIFSAVTAGINSNWSSNIANTAVMKLQAGDQITVAFQRSAASGNVLRGGNFANTTTFAAYRVY